MFRFSIAAPVCWVTGVSLAAFGLGPAPFRLLLMLPFVWLGIRVFLDRRHALPVTVLTALLLVGNGHYHLAESRLVTAVEPPMGYSAAGKEGDSVSAQLAGILDSPVEVDGDRAVFYADVDRWAWEEGPVVAVEGGERVYVTVRLAEQQEQRVASGWQRGSRLLLTGTVKAPDAAGNFGGFDFRDYLHKNNVHWTVTVKGASNVEVQASAPGGLLDRLLRWNDQVRLGASGRLDSLFPGEEAGYMKGLLIGIREDLDPERFRDFSRLGLTHILAISGLHVGVFIWAVTALCRRIGLTRDQTSAMAFWTTPLYVVFTGSSPSVVRSGMTAMAGLYAARKGWLKDGLTLLGAAAWVMLLWNPLYIRDVGFQLSFLVTGGLLVGVPAIGRLIPIPNRMIHGSLTVSLTAQLVSFPLSIYYFNQQSLLSLFANLLLVPLISFIVTPLGYGVLLMSFIWPWGGRMAAWPVSWLNRFTFWCVEQADRFPAAQMIWPTPSSLWILLYYGLFIAGTAILARRSQLAAMERRRIYLAVQAPRQLRMYGRSAVLVWLLLAVLLVYGYSPYLLTERGIGTVSFLNVGQGDAALVRTPTGKHLLIDGGGTVSFRKAGEGWKERRDPYEVGRKTVVPLLKKRGVHRLDSIIISHEDTDHIGGLSAVIEEIPVGRILFNGTLKSSPSAEKLFRLALQRGIPLVPVFEGDVFELDAASKLTILAPDRPDQADQVQLAEEQNGLTVVALLNIYRWSFLFTGDMGMAEEQELLKQIQSPPQMPGSPVERFLASPHVDVLKVAHHGSKNSSSADWLELLQPTAAVISAGKNNIYGHPHPLVLERLGGTGAKILRTDRNGEIRFAAGNNSLRVQVKTMQP